METGRDLVQTAYVQLATEFERHGFRLHEVQAVTAVTTVVEVELRDGWASPLGVRSLSSPWSSEAARYSTLQSLAKR